MKKKEIRKKKLEKILNEENSHKIYLKEILYKKEMEIIQTIKSNFKNFNNKLDDIFHQRENHINQHFNSDFSSYSYESATDDIQLETVCLKFDEISIENKIKICYEKETDKINEEEIRDNDETFIYFLPSHNLSLELSNNKILQIDRKLKIIDLKALNDLMKSNFIQGIELENLSDKTMEFLLNLPNSVKYLDLVNCDLKESFINGLQEFFLKQTALQKVCFIGHKFFHNTKNKTLWKFLKLNSKISEANKISCDSEEIDEHSACDMTLKYPSFSRPFLYMNVNYERTNVLK